MDDISLPQEMTDLEMKSIVEHIHRFTGMSIASNKKTMMQSRIRPRLRALGLKSYAEYIVYLDKNRNEVQEFVNQITTNETSFFRTNRVWDFFQQDFLPKWHKANVGKKLKIWSGAASSGEEIYTIAMCCADFSSRSPGFDFHITGTDISTAVLSVAEKGYYQGKSIEGLKHAHPDHFAKYFSVKGEGFVVSPLVRQKVSFSTHNLMTINPNKFDLIFLRNVLIYFEPKDQEAILSNVGKSLIDDGTIILGESESLTGLATPFHFSSPQVYCKKAVA